MTLPERYNEAKSYKELVESAGWKSVEAYLSDLVDRAAKCAVTTSFNSQAQEHDSLTEARAFNFVLQHVQQKADSFVALEKQAKEQGLV
jgi:hypothetical protein